MHPFTLQAPPFVRKCIQKGVKKNTLYTLVCVTFSLRRAILSRERRQKRADEGMNLCNTNFIHSLFPFSGCASIVAFCNDLALIHKKPMLFFIV